MFDVFYLDQPTGLFAHEKPARSIEHARDQSRTRYLWIVDYLSDYSKFDFLWEPVPWEAAQCHAWPSQWQVEGGTFLVPKIGFTDVNREHDIVPKHTSVFKVLIDHLDNSTLELESVRTVRFFESYLATLRRIANSAQEEYLWICSSVCDYSNFDFTWHPDPWQTQMLHVFASEDQKFGDTFYMHVPSARQNLAKVKLLDWYALNFVNEQPVPRRHMPVNWHQKDSHVSAVQSHTWSAPLEIFTCTNVDRKMPVVSLWQDNARTIVPLSAGASAVIVPKIAASMIRSQLYDYPHVDKTHANTFEDREQDVVFISNGEPMAEDNWQKLQSICPRAVRSDGITGREAAYKAAAQLSTTPWFFAVFAKTEVLPEFKFDFQPDRMQQPKHYIFHSRNPLNGLEYGAMNINLYNRQLVLDTVPGLDFTLSAAHTVVPICASISRFNTDPWITWRSAFRETMKLRREVDQGADVEISHRLHVWCTQAQGENAQHCIQGANDGVEYYEAVNGDLEMLKLSFDWQWCQDYYFDKYGCRPWLKL
jgi:hypothetical protein